MQTYLQVDEGQLNQSLSFDAGMFTSRRRQIESASLVIQTFVFLIYPMRCQFNRDRWDTPTSKKKGEGMKGGRK
jgi:hypothetical protein